MDSYIIKRNYKKAFLLLLAGMASIMAGVCLLIICYNGYYKPHDLIARNYYTVVATSYFGIIFFLILELYLVYAILFQPIILKISSEGFEDHSAIMSLGLILWKDVDYINIVTLASKKWIGVILQADSNIIQHAPLFKRIIIKANMNMGYPPVTISLDQTKTKIEDVVRVMKQFHEDSKSKP